MNLYKFPQLGKKYASKIYRTNELSKIENTHENGISIRNVELHQPVECRILILNVIWNCANFLSKYKQTTHM